MGLQQPWDHARPSQADSLPAVDLGFESLACCMCLRTLGAPAVRKSCKGHAHCLAALYCLREETPHCLSWANLSCQVGEAGTIPPLTQCSGLITAKRGLSYNCPKPASSTVVLLPQRTLRFSLTCLPQDLSEGLNMSPLSSRVKPASVCSPHNHTTCLGSLGVLCCHPH